MKAKTALAALLLLLCLTGCGAKKAETSMFVQVAIEPYYEVVYHKDTKVMYVASTVGYNRGTVTVLLNPDGTPMVWEGD